MPLLSIAVLQRYIFSAVWEASKIYDDEHKIEGDVGRIQLVKNENAKI